MNIDNQHLRQKVLQVFLTGMLCAVCCTAFFGCGKKSESVLILGDTEDQTAGVFTGTEDTGQPETEEAAPEEFSGEAAGSENPRDTEMDELVVYICGQVKYPGVYTLEGGSRICDAVDAAGGMTEDAAEDYWNLAELLSDGDMIYIPTQEEASERQNSAADTSLNGSGQGQTAQTGTAGTDGRININTASAEELTQIPGVGSTRADAIIAYREKNGSFSSIDEITNVSGIGEATFAKMKDSIKTD